MSDLIYCPYCGHATSDASNTCEFCGREIYDDEDEQWVK